MRRILPSALLLLFLLGLPVGPGVRAQVQGFPQGVAAGDVAARAAIVWTRTDGPAPLSVEYATTPGFTGARTTTPFYTNPEHDYTANVELTGLDPGQRYYYRFVSGSARSASGTFVMPPAGDRQEVVNYFASEHTRVETGLRAFREYWPIRTPPDAPGRLYRSFRWGRTVEFFILDARQYRTPAFRIDGPEKTMLGRTQKQWLLDGLARSVALVRVVVSTVPLRHHSGDSWEGYAFERNEILRFIAARRIANVIFLVGDVHYAALLRHPEGPYEGGVVHVTDQED